MLVFSPSWSLMDAGVVYSNQERVHGTGRPVEIRAVGAWFRDYLRGYSGFGVAFSYLQLIFLYYYQELGRGYPVDMVEIIVLFGAPFFITILLIPSLIILDLTRKHRIQFIRKIANKMGITKVTLAPTL
jgi:hypothetical protein